MSIGVDDVFANIFLGPIGTVYSAYKLKQEAKAADASAALKASKEQRKLEKAQAEAAKKENSSATERAKAEAELAKAETDLEAAKNKRLQTQAASEAAKMAFDAENKMGISEGALEAASLILPVGAGFAGWALGGIGGAFAGAALGYAVKSVAIPESEKEED